VSHFHGRGRQNNRCRQCNVGGGGGWRQDSAGSVEKRAGTSEQSFFVDGQGCLGVCAVQFVGAAFKRLRQLLKRGQRQKICPRQTRVVAENGEHFPNVIGGRNLQQHIR
jgi:hypothetical protein